MIDEKALYLWGIALANLAIYQGYMKFEGVLPKNINFTLRQNIFLKD